MKVRYQEFHQHKFGNTEDEYEDAFFANTRQALPTFAIADGASESSFAKEWANLLTLHAAQIDCSPQGLTLQDVTRFQNVIKKITPEWHKLLSRKKLPWYAEEKAKQGAFAAILAVWIHVAQATYNWLAVGDSCLFHIRGDVCLHSAPIQNTEDFGNMPYLVSSIAEQNKDLLQYTHRSETCIPIQPADRLYLLTDALAHWFLQESQAGQIPWEQLDELLQRPTDLTAWLQQSVSEKKLRNDDITLVKIAFV